MAQMNCSMCGMILPKGGGTAQALDEFGWILGDTSDGSLLHKKEPSPFAEWATRRTPCTLRAVVKAQSSMPGLLLAYQLNTRRTQLYLQTRQL